MESQPTIRQRFNSDLQYRLALIAYVPILCLGVLAAGGLLFLSGSAGVRVFGIFGLLGVAVSFFIAYRTISSILDSIGEVAISAQSLVGAQEALLEGNRGPIESWPRLNLETGDELGQLSAAINSLHDNTLEVDQNQNESIRKGISNIVVNLARRSQTLLDRQVEYIDQLENTEEDPDRLEQMFKVDHLATRMRRNAESLLVLAEADPGRRRGGPVDVADVLRVAMGEIENYQHIELASVEPGQVTAAAAVDLAHMAAELMENATQFSPPDTPVEVSGRLDGDRYEISIVDHGVGMPADQLASANDILTNPPKLGLAMGRSLGFVVIGRLADRIGSDVALSETDGSGVTARISVPTSVFTEVGDNTAVRRSVQAPEPEPSVVPEDTDAAEEEQHSPALSKLLGLDVASLAGTATAPEADAPVEQPSAPAEESWTPPPVTPDAPVTGPAEESWTPPPVTPDAPVAGPAEESWTPPPVTPDAPVTGPAAEDPPLPDLASDPFASDPFATDPFAAETEPPTIAQPEQPVGLDPAALNIGDDEPAWTPPAVTELPDTVPLPSKLEDAIPTGDAFETGMASLLEEPTTPTPEAAAPTVAQPAPVQEQAMPHVAADDDQPERESTSSGLTRRKRGESKVPIGEGRPVAASNRDPDEIRSMLSRYRDGIKGNRNPNADPGEEG